MDQLKLELIDDIHVESTNQAPNEPETHDVRVIEPVEDYHMRFNLSEFNEFLNRYRDKLMKETTCILNKKYYIQDDGIEYKITKIKGEICVKRAKCPRLTVNNRLDALENMVSQLVNAVNALSRRV